MENFFYEDKDKTNLCFMRFVLSLSSLRSNTGMFLVLAFWGICKVSLHCIFVQCCTVQLIKSVQWPTGKDSNVDRCWLVGWHDYCVYRLYNDNYNLNTKSWRYKVPLKCCRFYIQLKIIKWKGAKQYIYVFYYLYSLRQFS